MARVRSPNRDKAYEIYKLNNGEILLKDIAAQLGVKDTQVRKWKSQDKWEEKLKGTLPINKSNVTNKKVVKKKDTKQTDFNEAESILENTKLTDKQKLFCIYYIKSFNATKAYQKAYQCKYDVANSEGYKLLVNPCIKSEIQKLKKNKLNRAMLSEDDIFQRYIDIAFADITDYITFGKKEVEGEFGPYVKNYIDLNDSNNIDGSLISEISEGKDGIKIKLQDKMKALQWLSDRMDLLPVNTRMRLENEKTKLELDVMKLELEIMKQGGQDEEVEDDGFMDALKSEVGDTWDD